MGEVWNWKPSHEIGEGGLKPHENDLYLLKAKSN